jgi:hypothetical protein
MEWTMPNENRIYRIYRRVHILKKKRKKSVADQFDTVKYRPETYGWTQKLTKDGLKN